MKFFVPSDRRGEAMELLRSIQTRLQLSTDHLSSCLEEREYPCPHILYAEQWKSEDALYEHIRSSAYRRVLAAIELSSRPPDVIFHFVSQSKGMELIQTLRGESQQAPTQN
jgi:quinol monooxygenase YgiN